MTSSSRLVLCFAKEVRHISVFSYSVRVLQVVLTSIIGNDRTDKNPQNGEFGTKHGAAYELLYMPLFGHK